MDLESEGSPFREEAVELKSKSMVSTMASEWRHSERVWEMTKQTLRDVME